MKFKQIILTAGLAWMLNSCIYFENGLNVVNSHSIPEKQVTLDSVVFKPHLLVDTLAADTTTHFQQQNLLEKKLQQMFQQVELISKSQSDSAWKSLTKNWNTFRINHLNLKGLPVFNISDTGSVALNSPEVSRDWAELNMRLLNHNQAYHIFQLSECRLQ